MGERTRTRQVYLRLSDREYDEVKALRRLLGLRYRELLMLGTRHARTIYTQEQRRQEGRQPD